MTASVNNKNIANSSDRLSIAYSIENIPVAYANNYFNPFKLYFYYIDSFGVGNITEIAIFLLKDFTLAEIKEIKKLLAKEVFKYADYKLTTLKHNKPSLIRREFTRKTDLLVNYLISIASYYLFLLS